MENPIFNGKIHYKWPFSIAMLVYQRVSKHHQASQNWMNGHIFRNSHYKTMACIGIPEIEAMS